MERTITVIVSVSHERHAALIKSDIESTVRERTPFYHIDLPKIGPDTIANKVNE